MWAAECSLLIAGVEGTRWFRGSSVHGRSCREGSLRQVGSIPDRISRWLRPTARSSRLRCGGSRRIRYLCIA